MSAILNALAKLVELATRPDVQQCQKCGMFSGDGFCDRGLLGEPGACVFKSLAPCKTCASKTPCFGLPCELSDRISALRKAAANGTR